MGQSFYLPALSFPIWEMVMKICPMGLVVVRLKGDRADWLTFLPSVESHSRKEPTILARHMQHRPACESWSPSSSSLSPSPVLSSWLFPRRPQGSQANCQTAGRWDWLSGTLPFCPLHPLGGSHVWGSPPGKIRPHGCPACYASTCREFIWNQHQKFVFIWGMQRSQGLWTELNSRTLYDSHQPMSIRPFTWKEARLSLSNSSKRRPHTSCSLKFHFSPLDDATQSCALSKTRIIRDDDEKWCASDCKGWKDYTV